MRVAPCPNCGKNRMYATKDVSAGGGHAPNYLPGLGGSFSAEKFNLVLCADCGLVRFFARENALRKLSDSRKWERI